MHGPQIQRHGARYPTASAGQKIASAVAKLKAIPTYTDSRFDFIHSYTYDLGADNLLPFGAVQSYDSGAEVYERYPDLVTRNNMPFVRASSGQRVVESANNWTAGFAAASHGKFAPALSVVLDEAVSRLHSIFEHRSDPFYSVMTHLTATCVPPPGPLMLNKPPGSLRPPR
jgi:hypothetical protein